ncbi:DUF1223 domain-containing protein [Mesorhizobium sp. AaZ16]|uniref:DUF1223 domain-containing protein n=1 Tax=Mesorhizobium sp. AaZ16 TaxID=3402289 RepID=UPI00374F0F72
MTFRFFSALAAAMLAVPIFAAAASAEDAKPLGVIELFTSQGCSSCPPADALLAEMAARDDFVALAYHVDYWDYLGWRDTLGSPENTARQHGYGRSMGIRSVYTPQAVINGRIHVNGSSRSKISGAVEELNRSGQGLGVGLSVARTGESVVIEAEGAKGETKNAHLVVVYFEPTQPVVIERGENAGRTVTYWNAVTDIQTAGMWHGEAARFELPASEVDRKGGCAVLLQSVSKEGLPGPILGAAMIRNPGS